ncbi:NUDIX domain-containing protein [Halovenus sp. WSH3]|uniref:NUDIX domain-containing protein n=1 Tax=Halovenus carboxidivorans TaxID=2692199 RepID=A0A6B0T5C9_9EURY|nr:NUDIX domain-containing protein [Halovenus carboxidivorans]MXR50431.1 NUDIX domain-containing protein [Halovenus carboxidivorans]
MSEWIPDHEWETIVRRMPIVSVDLLVRYDGGLVFGKRTNEPAKGEWFIPGGRVSKGETRQEAVHRVAEDELGISVEIVESLGAFEHFYDTADVEGVESKHYLANGYVVDLQDGNPGTDDDQHDAVEVFQSPPESLHPHIRAYLDASETLDW